MESNDTQQRNYDLSFPVNLHAGFFKYELYFLLFEPSYMVFVRIGSDKHRQIVEEANVSTGEGNDCLNSLMGIYEVLDNYCIMLDKMPLHQILSENSGSFYIYYNDLNIISITQNDANDYHNDKQWNIEIKTAIGKYNGTIDKCADIKLISNVLSNLLGSKFSRW